MPVYLDPKTVRTFPSACNSRTFTCNFLSNTQLSPPAARYSCRVLQKLACEAAPWVDHLMYVCRWICTTMAFATVFYGSYFIMSR